MLGFLMAQHEGFVLSLITVSHTDRKPQLVFSLCLAPVMAETHVSAGLAEK
jgi:hypothetical protein